MAGPAAWHRHGCIFGIIAGIALLTLVWLFGLYAILDGRPASRSASLGIAVNRIGFCTIVQGVVSVLAGVIALIWPGVTALTFVVAFWAIVPGDDRRRFRLPQERVERLGLDARRRDPGTWSSASCC